MVLLLFCMPAIQANHLARFIQQREHHAAIKPGIVNSLSCELIRFDQARQQQLLLLLLCGFFSLVQAAGIITDGAL